jgi:uncharacterized damage-inducible protein DinB
VIAEERIQRLERSVKQLTQQIEGLPAEVLYRAPSQGEWPVMSTLAHLAELLPYWAHQAAAIAAQPGKSFGRTHDDPDRIGAVQQHGHDSLDVAVNRIRAGLQECISVLSALPAEAWASAGQHPTRGRMTIEQLVDAFLVSHAEEHADQTQATLKTLRSTEASAPPTR